MTRAEMWRGKTPPAPVSVTTFLVVVLGIVVPRVANGSTFQEKLASPVAKLDSAGSTLVEALVDLAYEYKIPMGLEYVDRLAVTQPLALKARGEPLRRVIELLVAQLPGCRVTFSGVWWMCIAQPPVLAPRTCSTRCCPTSKCRMRIHTGRVQS